MKTYNLVAEAESNSLPIASRLAEIVNEVESIFFAFNTCGKYPFRSTMIFSCATQIPRNLKCPAISVLARMLKGNSERAIVALFKRTPSSFLTVPFTVTLVQTQASQALFK